MYLFLPAACVLSLLLFACIISLLSMPVYTVFGVFIPGKCRSDILRLGSRWKERRRSHKQQFTSSSQSYLSTVTNISILVHNVIATAAGKIVAPPRPVGGVGAAPPPPPPSNEVHMGRCVSHMGHLFAYGSLLTTSFSVVSRRKKVSHMGYTASHMERCFPNRPIRRVTVMPHV